MRLSFILAFVFFCIIGHAQSLPKLKENALSLFQRGKYRQALELLQMYQQRKPDDFEVMKALGISAYHAYNLPLAKQYLSGIAEDKKADATTFLMLARTFHAELLFKEAIKNYKLFLQKAKSDDPQRRAIIADIKRCGAGLRIILQPELALVESLGENVNSLHDEFAPVLSPNFDDRVYFSAAREDSEGGLRNDEGLVDFKNGHYNSDVYSTELDGNDWTFPTHLDNLLINTPRQETLLDFSKNGRVMLFFRGTTHFAGEILVDTFKSNDETRTLPPTLVAPINSKDGDNSLSLFNDSIMIFAGRKAGGFGGLDLYYTVNREGVWSEPINLGKQVNTPFDETTPFLSKDGRTLYFSSNGLNSMGGFDIFKTSFNIDSLDFNEPVNLGKPINSAGDDTHFRLTPDGMKAFYCSNRKEGFGERDIYMALFKTYQNEQTAQIPPVFYQIADFKTAFAQIGQMGEPTKKIETFAFNSLFYDTDEDLLRGDNLRQMRQVVEVLRKYPNLVVILTLNSTAGEKHSFDLYFGMKRAEILAKFLTDNGLSNTQIILKSVGANYPIARLEVNGQLNTAGEKMNRRVDIAIRNITNEPISVDYVAPPVSQFMVDTRGDKWTRHIQGLSYKIQVISTKRIYDNEFVNKYNDVMMEASGTEGVYAYTVGLCNDYSTAERLRRDVMKNGIRDAFIQPYVDGVKLVGDDVKRFLSRYSDLNNYLASKKKP